MNETIASQEFQSPLPPALKYDSDIRLFELLSSLSLDDPVLATLCKRHGIASWEGRATLVREITRDGSNTIVSLLMGQPENSYLDVVRSVAVKLKVNAGHGDDETPIERKCLESVINRYLQTAPEEERQSIMRIIIETGDEFHVDEWSRRLKSGALRLGTLTLLIRQIGARATAQIVNRIVSGIVSRQVAKEASRRAAGLAGFAVPLLNIAMIGWTVWDLAGPAYRKTIPTVLEIALLRLEHDAAETNEVQNTATA